MIVKCKAIYNQNTKEYLDIDTQGNININYHYNVLELDIAKKGIVYYINTDSSGLASSSIMVLAKDFEIVTNNIPENWILFKERSKLSPDLWTNMSLWEVSFWQDYFEDLPAAIACYRSEMKKIVAADKDYIQIMIDERSDNDRFYTWQDTMLPLFAEVLAGK